MSFYENGNVIADPADPLICPDAVSSTLRPPLGPEVVTMDVAHRRCGLV